MFLTLQIVPGIGLLKKHRNKQYIEISDIVITRVHSIFLSDTPYGRLSRLLVSSIYQTWSLIFVQPTNQPDCHDMLKCNGLFALCQY